MKRLNHTGRDNNFGRNPTQRRMILESVESGAKKAKKAGFEFIDASLSPKQIFNKICN